MNHFYPRQCQFSQWKQKITFVWPTSHHILKAKILEICGRQKQKNYIEILGVKWLDLSIKVGY